MCGGECVCVVGQQSKDVWLNNKWKTDDQLQILIYMVLELTTKHNLRMQTFLDDDLGKVRDRSGQFG